MFVDLNCDLGESFGAYQKGNDKEILHYVTSANIACGFHAGDPSTMRETVKRALEKNAAIGAHPGLPDLIGFGRRNLDIAPQEAYDMVLYQIGALHAFVQAEGGRLKHVKPHGALYNMAARNSELAAAIAEAVYKADPNLILFGLSGSTLVKTGEKLGLHTANEVFADRTYQLDGTLTPRKHANAFITSDKQSINQILRMVKEGRVCSVQGDDAIVKADTICIHGDGPHALEFAKKIRSTLEAEGIEVRAR
ncbi:LamB/YcsF family protein [Heyndrickxia acidicola]|uniref:5-oxoprolinase subunit A n=1 Tax=Heyndrickxia acidicola TaxID=209389 RepID=A0ABU6MGC7_9BACI|nr:5-oxoprolinase subunit PxpA [Heyndrickxia acidicola]MED1203731.1 LamB/YcsF family protein [Heyndrickxia acidicola]